MTGVTSITGKSRLTPLERDNKKLKKQKRVYESRITSLQTQLSDIQQIVPELMTKSKSQIQKLELVVETQRQASQERERSLTEEIAHLRQQNEQLQAATRVRLQSSNVGRQDEIDQLKMRLEVREATIKKLEMMSSSGKFSRVKGVPMRKKKKKATNGQDDNDGEMSSVISATDSAFSAI
jgi:chromosome segregation ATPase